MDRQTFFMVYLQDGNTPTHRHATLNGAEEEAKRLAEQFGKKAWVLCALKSFEIVKFKETDCRPPIDDLPF